MTVAIRTYPDPGMYGEVEGDLRPGREFRLYIAADEWHGTGRLDACEPPRRLLLTGSDATPCRRGWLASRSFAASDIRSGRGYSVAP